MSLSLECFLNSLQEYCSCVWPMFFLKLAKLFIAQMKVLGQFKKKRFLSLSSDSRFLEKPQSFPDVEV